MSISYVVIDGVTYNVPVTKIKRSADFLYKYAERTVDGVLHSELIGVYFNYELEFGRAQAVSDYTSLWNKLTEPVEFHTVSVPDEDGMHTYSAYFSGVGDEMIKYKNSQAYWKTLTVKFISQEPART